VTERIEFRELFLPGDPAIILAYKLLKQTFPASELIKLADWVARFTWRTAERVTGLLWHVLVVEQGKLLRGVVTGAYLTAVNIGFIGYLAIDRTLRSQGMGHLLRSRLLDLFQRDARRRHLDGVDAIVGEVEADNPWLAKLVKEHGAIALDIPYKQPSVRPGADPVSLVLYYQPLNRIRESLPAGEVVDLLYNIWRHAYKIARPWQDPLFREMLDAIAGRDEIPGRPADELPIAREAIAVEE
jgi:hypothetical protein